MGAAEQMSFAIKIDKARITNEKNEKLVAYSRFTDIYDFNNSYEQMMVDKKKKFTKLQHIVLNVVRKYGSKVVGVANASYSTYIEKIEALYGHKVHWQTVKNTIEKAEREGILLKFPGERKNKSYTANIIVFLRYEEMHKYEILNASNNEKELEERMQAQFEANSALLNFAENARVWQAEKARKQKEVEAAAKRAEDAARAMNEKKKQKSLYQQLLVYVHAKKITKGEFNEINRIAHVERKKMLAADPQLTQAQADELLLTTFINALNMKKDVKNFFAFLTHRIRRVFADFANGYKDTDYQNKRAQSASNGRTEAIPEWFNKRHENEPTNQNPSKLVDFEEERRKFLEKLQN